MNLHRLWMVVWLDLRQMFRRPLFWICLLLMIFMAWGLSQGHVRIAAGDSSVGGKKAFLTSEFANGQILALVTFLFYGFFLAVAAGLTIISDNEAGVGSVLHATPLRPDEYVRGKFLAVLAGFAVIALVQLAAMMMFNHLLPNAELKEFRGPFQFGNYLRPALYFTLPLLLFIGGICFATGTLTQKPILVFFLPVALILICGFFLWDFSPSWLDPRVNRLLMILDPAGFRWMNETWLKVDRGVDFYNTRPIPTDLTFWLNRLWVVGAGVGAVLLTERRFARTLKGAATGRSMASPARPESAPAPEAAPSGRGLRGLGMEAAPVPFLTGSIAVMRAELQELRNQPGLYLFVPLILIQTLGNAVYNPGAFDTPLLLTSGTLAVSAMNTITLLVTLLLLFYTVESQERERAGGLAPIYRSTPLPTASMLFGKALANSVVGVVVMMATLLGCVVVLLIQGRVPLDPRPFVLVWGVLLVPTFLAWTAFVSATLALVRNRYTTYAVGLGVILLTGWFQMRGKMTWAGNWDFWGAVQWTDMGRFELDAPAILLNRLMVLGLCAFFTVLTVKFHARRELDAVRLGERLSAGVLARQGLRLLPWFVGPVAAIIALHVMVQDGFQGKAAEKRQKDYWRKNLATWRGVPGPVLTSVDLDLQLDPPRRALTVKGVYHLRNDEGKAMRTFALTPGDHFRSIAWTMNDSACTPENRSGLYVFTPPVALAPGESLSVGFDCAGTFPDGVTKNGGGSNEFILNSGVVLTSFSPSFVPLIGFSEQIGVTKENSYEAREYPDDFHLGLTKSFVQTNGGIPYHVRATISGPAEYTYNCVGTRIRDEVQGERRTTVWETEHPVAFFNVVAGKWAVKEGKHDTVIYYHPEHAYNIEEMSRTLDAARVHYSEWFAPYPWKTLKLSEFPALARYAQGFPTNITFSESIGFLTKDDPRAAVAFLVTAHEAAHQWWGNILNPGEGPGGNVLSEGMAHFSTGLLYERVRGLRNRIEFFVKIEDRYNENRQADSERPLVRLDETRDGDTTVLYDKGGWVAWMLSNLMGREQALAGMQEFIRRYQSNPDHPVLQDFLTVMRPFAPDSAAFDAFASEWYHQVVVPEYRLTDARRSPAGADSSFDVTVTIQNIGTGTMPVDVAATSGKRWPDEKTAKAPGPSAESPANPLVEAARSGADLAVPPAGAGEAPDYRESRTRITLAAGESRTITLHCPFKPEKVLVDPDALVLQLRRKNAETTL